MAVLVPASLLLAGCTPPPRPDTELAKRLAADAAPLLAKCPVRGKIDAALWPASFAAAGVDQVMINSEGLEMRTGHSRTLEAGVFIPCDSQRFRPRSRPGDDPVLIRVEGDVYTYLFPD